MAPKPEYQEFDQFFEQGDYKDGDEPQAFADYIASKTGKKVVGKNVESGTVVASDPRFDDPKE